MQVGLVVDGHGPLRRPTYLVSCPFKHLNTCLCYPTLDNGVRPLGFVYCVMVVTEPGRGTLGLTRE